VRHTLPHVTPHTREIAGFNQAKGSTALKQIKWGFQRIAHSGRLVEIRIGDGAAMMDTNLYRKAAGLLQTDGALAADGGYYVGAGATLITRHTSDLVSLNASAPDTVPGCSPDMVTTGDIHLVPFTVSVSLSEYSGGH
jgi:hypothetical protein